MEKKRIIAVGILLAALIAVWLGIRQFAGSDEIKNPALTITALPVGKADALILKTDDWAAMIDTGEERDGSYIRETLEAAGIDHLNLLLVTHFDKDHVGSAAELLGTVGADQVLMPDYEGTSGDGGTADNWNGNTGNSCRIGEHISYDLCGG